VYKTAELASFRAQLDSEIIKQYKGIPEGDMKGHAKMTAQ